MKTVKTATGISKKKPIIQIRGDPLKALSQIGTFVSKNLLWTQTTIPEIRGFLWNKN